jgi:hypothetical protein
MVVTARALVTEGDAVEWLAGKPRRAGLVQASQRYKFVIAVSGKGHERANPIQIAKHAGLIAAVFAGVGQAPGADCHSCGAGLHGEGDKHGWHGGAGGGLFPGSPGGLGM